MHVQLVWEFSGVSYVMSAPFTTVNLGWFSVTGPFSRIGWWHSRGHTLHGPVWPCWYLVVSWIWTSWAVKLFGEHPYRILVGLKSSVTIWTWQASQFERSDRALTRWCMTKNGNATRDTKAIQVPVPCHRPLLTPAGRSPFWNYTFYCRYWTSKACTLLL